MNMTENKKLERNYKEEINGGMPIKKQVIMMGIRFHDFEESINWSLVKKEEKKARESLNIIKEVIIKIEKIYYEEDEEISEERLANAYKEWANDPNEWKDIKAKY